MITAEVNLCSVRVAGFALTQNDKLLVEHLDLLEEYREASIIRLAEYQQKLAQLYNKDVKTREFSTRDLVLRKAVGSMRNTNTEKLAPSRERPYRVIVIAGAGAYYLEDLDEMLLPRPWNVHNLKKFYH